MPTTGGPVCPPGENILRFLFMFGEFVISNEVDQRVYRNDDHITQSMNRFCGVVIEHTFCNSILDFPKMDFKPMVLVVAGPYSPGGIFSRFLLVFPQRAGVCADFYTNSNA